MNFKITTLKYIALILLINSICVAQKGSQIQRVAKVVDNRFIKLNNNFSGYFGNFGNWGHHLDSVRGGFYYKDSKYNLQMYNGGGFYILAKKKDQNGNFHTVEEHSFELVTSQSDFHPGDQTNTPIYDSSKAALNQVLLSKDFNADGTNPDGDPNWSIWKINQTEFDYVSDIKKRNNANYPLGAYLKSNSIVSISNDNDLSFHKKLKFADSTFLKQYPLGIEALTHFYTLNDSTFIINYQIKYNGIDELSDVIFAPVFDPEITRYQKPFEGFFSNALFNYTNTVNGNVITISQIYNTNKIDSTLIKYYCNILPIQMPVVDKDSLLIPLESIKYQDYLSSQISSPNPVNFNLNDDIYSNDSLYNILDNRAMEHTSVGDIKLAYPIKIKKLKAGNRFTVSFGLNFKKLETQISDINSIFNDFYYNFLTVGGDNSSLTKLNITPNPSNRDFNLTFTDKFDGFSSIEIYDLYGKKIDFTIIENNTLSGIISLKNQSSGIYILKYSSDKNTYYNKLVLSK